MKLSDNIEHLIGTTDRREVLSHMALALTLSDKYIVWRFDLNSEVNIRDEEYFK